MIYELKIEEGKEKPVINFLKQLDFLSIRAVKQPPNKKTQPIAAQPEDLPYFGACIDWDMDVKEMRNKNTSNRLAGWL